MARIDRPRTSVFRQRGRSYRPKFNPPSAEPDQHGNHFLNVSLGGIDGQ